MYNEGWVWVKLESRVMVRARVVVSSKVRVRVMVRTGVVVRREGKSFGQDWGYR